jgi:hypothetical protein
MHNFPTLCKPSQRGSAHIAAIFGAVATKPVSQVLVRRTDISALSLLRLGINKGCRLPSLTVSSPRHKFVCSSRALACLQLHGCRALGCHREFAWLFVRLLTSESTHWPATPHPPSAAADVELTRRKGGGSSGIDALAPAKGTFTWQEVAKHNTADSPWVIVERKVRQRLCRERGGGVLSPAVVPQYRTLGGVCFRPSALLFPPL